MEDLGLSPPQAATRTLIATAAQTHFTPCRPTLYSRPMSRDNGLAPLSLPLAGPTLS